MTLAPCRNWSSLALLGMMILCLVQARGQGEPGAARRIGLDAFAGFSRLSPDYGPQTNYGVLLGGDVSHALQHFTPSVEFRYTYGTGATVAESSYLAGPKIEKKFGRLNPYATALFGYGSITFQHPVLYPTGYYRNDNSFVYDVGGGLDYDLSRHFSVKADGQYQLWRLGSETSHMTPVALSFGLTYRLPFKELPGRE